MTTDTLMAILPSALLFCGWICFFISTIVSAPENEKEFDDPKFWGISSIVCFVAALIVELIR